MKRFSATLATLADEKANFISLIESWPSEKLTYRPSSAEWCALEVLDHIVNTETAIMSAAQAGLGKPHRIGFTDRLRTAFLQKVFASDRKVKVPSRASQVLPGPDLELKVILGRWAQSRAQADSFVAITNAKLQNQGIFKHPVGGWMGIQQILDFFSVHLVHHRYQLERISRSFK